MCIHNLVFNTDDRGGVDLRTYIFDMGILELQNFLSRLHEKCIHSDIIPEMPEIFPNVMKGIQPTVLYNSIKLKISTKNKDIIQHFDSLKYF